MALKGGMIVLVMVAMLPRLPGGEAHGVCACPPLWTAFQSHCYRYFSMRNITWLGAEMQCRSFSVPCTDSDSNITLGHLASIHSEEEMDFLAVLYETLRSKVAVHKTRVWIGLHDRMTEGQWEWSDGSGYDFYRWESGQPNNYGDAQDCGEFHLNDAGHEWNDLQCELPPTKQYVPTGYICKMPQW